MAPRSKDDLLKQQDSSVDGEAFVVHPVDEPSYVVCTSKGPFLNPTCPEFVTAKEVNQSLNLNLGLPISPENLVLRKTLRWINFVLVMWWEDKFFALVQSLPIQWRRWVFLKAWKVYFAIHKRLLGRRTGLHPAASEEYHALTSFCWWGRLFPVTIPRMRFMLSQLSAWTDNFVTSPVTRVDHIMEGIDGHGYSTRVEGLYVQSGTRISSSNDKTKVIFWLYGGAYLSGDVDGNLSPAEMVGKACGVDVFLAKYSLIPEAKFDEIVWDACLAYRWLTTVKKVDPGDIIFYGISSGAGLAATLLQIIAKHNRGEKVHPSFLSEILSQMPSGAVLLCPFVDYTEPDPEGSFLQYSKHDLIVNQSVMEVGLPYFDIALGDRRKESSPCYNDCCDLPPLCVIVSEHETVFDQTIMLVNKCREQGVDVTLGVWKYLCHVFCFLSAFCPEGRQAMKFSNNWIIKQIGKG